MAKGGRKPKNADRDQTLFGKALHLWMTRRGTNSNRLGPEVGIDTSLLSRWSHSQEKGGKATEPGFYKVMKVAEKLDVSLSQFLMEPDQVDESDEVMELLARDKKFRKDVFALLRKRQRRKGGR